MPAAMLIMQFILQYGLPAAREIIAAAHKPNPTLEDWNKVFDLAEQNADKFLARTASVDAAGVVANL